MNENIKVALIHDYLLQYGGAEKTLEAIMELYPDADIFTSFYEEKNFPAVFKNRNIFWAKNSSKVITYFPILAKYFTFLIPFLFESFDLSSYDLVISDSSSYAKGVLTKPNQLHISYIHTPPRFLYGYSVESSKRNKWYYSPVVNLVDNFLRVWDYAAAQRADILCCNSKEVQKRIQKFYNRPAEIIYPPIETPAIAIPTNINKILEDNYYLIAGRLVKYKNFDLVIKAFNNMPNFKLKIIGKGVEESNLKKLVTGDNIEFLGHLPDDEKHKYMKNCLGLINAIKDEDFGIVPLEVQANGRPVLGHRSAGHLETIIEGKTGEFFDSLTVTNLISSIKEFDNNIKSQKYNPTDCIEQAKKFSKENFKETFKKFVEHEWRKFDARASGSTNNNNRS